MLTLERKGFWFWGDRLTFPVLIFIFWVVCVLLFLQARVDGLTFLLVSLLSLAGAVLSFKKIRHIRSLNINGKTLIIDFTNETTQVIPVKDITSVGLDYKTDTLVRHHVGYNIGYRKEGKNLAIRMGKGYSINGQPISDHEALTLLGKELGFKKTATAWGGWMTWTKS